MRSARAHATYQGMGSLPSLRATGHRVWNLIGVAPVVGRGAQRGESEARLQALRDEVERLSAVRSNVERATQLARVLDAVTAMAETHGLSEPELHALRVGVAGEREPLAVTPGPLGLRQQLKQ